MYGMEAPVQKTMDVPAWAPAQAQAQAQAHVPAQAQAQAQANLWCPCRL